MLTLKSLFLGLLLMQCEYCQSNADYGNAGYVEIPATGLVVAVDPDELLGIGLARHWQCINEEFDDRHIQSQPFSKINFILDPVPSPDGAVIQVSMKGVAVGETRTNSNNVEFVANSLTDIKTKLTLFLSTAGLSYSKPLIKTSTKLSLESVKSGKNILAGAFVKTGIRKFPDQVDKQAKPFAKYQVERNLRTSLARMEEDLYRSAGQLANRYPVLSSLQWHVSSDEKKVYFSGNSTSFSACHSTAPVRVSLHEQLANELANMRLSGRTFDANQIRQRVMRSSMTARNPQQSNTTAEKDWTITFDQYAIQLSFFNNHVRARFYLSEFNTGDRVLPPTQIDVDYELKNHRGRWYLSRAGEIGIETEHSGARQQIVRSILRKRLETVVPTTFPLPELRLPNHVRKDLDLKIGGLSAQDQAIVVDLRHR